MYDQHCSYCKVLSCIDTYVLSCMYNNIIYYGIIVLLNNFAQYSPLLPLSINNDVPWGGGVKSDEYFFICLPFINSAVINRQTSSRQEPRLTHIPYQWSEWYSL